MRLITLPGETDLDAFRQACRDLAGAGVAPEQVVWQTSRSDHSDLFAANELEAPSAIKALSAGAATSNATRTAQLSAPSAFVSLCETVILHRDPDRFALLYRLLWRMQRDARLRSDPLDADWLLLQQMAQAVRRDQHKMKAFVRFRRIDGPVDDPVGDPVGDPVVDPLTARHFDVGGDNDTPMAEPLHVAWFEPEHHIVAATAPFFMRRFAQMRWAILTPRLCVRWQGTQLTFGPGVSRDQAPPADAGETLWLTYYRNIFNPARLKMKMMQKEMPKRYWKNLPEAMLIDELSRQAPERTSAMLEQHASEPIKRRPGTVARASPLAGLDQLPNNAFEMREATNRCRACPIGELATQSVVGEGPMPSRLMFVGEQPGDQEDLRGSPFVGPAGQLFNCAMKELGWAREHVFVTNAVKHFKYELRGKRRIHKTPAQSEAAVCLDWLEREIVLVQPEAIVALGATAARSLLGETLAILSERGRWRQRSDGRPVLITLHPSALLRLEPEERADAYARWLEDLRLAAEFAPTSSHNGPD